MADWNSIPKQTILAQDGQIGDCWRCCIAAVLGLSAEDVPHFGNDNGKWNHCCDQDTQRWLNERGYRLLCVTAHGCTREPFEYPCFSVDLPQFPHVPLITCGPTQRSKGLGKHHAVVSVGGTVVYDPHPSESGLVGIAEQFLIFRPVA